MTYIELKSLINSKVKEYMDKGLTQEEAEARFLEAGIAMLKSKIIGLGELVLMSQILGYDFAGEMAESMNGAKQALREKYGLNEGIEIYKGEGLSEEMATKAVIESLHESFKEGQIEGPELLNTLLWALGYRLKEQFFINYYKGKKPKLSYEADD